MVDVDWNPDQMQRLEDAAMQFAQDYGPLSDALDGRPLARMDLAARLKAALQSKALIVCPAEGLDSK